MVKISSNESSRSYAISWKTRRHFCRWLYHGQISRALSRTFTVIGRIRGCPLFFLPFVRPISDVSIGERARRKGERARSRTVGWKAVQEETVQEEEEEEEWVDGRGGGEGGGGCFGSGWSRGWKLRGQKILPLVEVSRTGRGCGWKRAGWINFEAKRSDCPRGWCIIQESSPARILPIWRRWKYDRICRLPQNGSSDVHPVNLTPSPNVPPLYRAKLHRSQSPDRSNILLAFHAVLSG